MQDSFSFSRLLQLSTEQPATEVLGTGNLQSLRQSVEAQAHEINEGDVPISQPRAVKPPPQVLYTYEPHYLAALVGNQLVSTAQALLASQEDGDVLRVNPKQYHAILRRREQRKMADEKNQLLLIRRAILYKHRHEVAMARARNSQGKFLPDSAAAEGLGTEAHAGGD